MKITFRSFSNERNENTMDKNRKNYGNENNNDLFFNSLCDLLFDLGKTATIYISVVSRKLYNHDAVYIVNNYIHRRFLWIVTSEWSNLDATSAGCTRFWNEHICHVQIASFVIRCPYSDSFSFSFVYFSKRVGIFSKRYDLIVSSKIIRVLWTSFTR